MRGGAELIERHWLRMTTTSVEDRKQKRRERRNARLTRKRKEARKPSLEARVGVSYRQFHHWTQLGYIRATVENGRFKYSLNEMRIARIIGSLVNIGLAPRPAAHVARELIEGKKEGAIILADGKLRLTGTFAQLLRSRGEVKAESTPEESAA